MASVAYSRKVEEPCPIRSFVRRQGRFSLAQQQALAHALRSDRCRVSSSVPDLPSWFGRQAPCWLDIGCGNGSALLPLAAARREINFLAIDVYRPGLGSLLRGMEQQELSNIRVLEGDAMQLLKTGLRPQSLAAILLWFPDPWPKKRHHKRRFLRPENLPLLARALADDGLFHLASDDAGYAVEMQTLLAADGDFANADADGGFSARPDWRFPSHFANRAAAAGQPVFDLIYRRCQRWV